MWQGVIERARSKPGINGEWIDPAAAIVEQGTLARRPREWRVKRLRESVCAQSTPSM